MKLVAVDIDGTFVDHNNQYDLPLFRELLTIMQQRKIRFVVASGNQYPHLAELFPEDLRNKLDYVAENGALVLSEGQELACSGLSQETFGHILTEIKKIPGVNYIVSTKHAGLIPRSSTPDFSAETNHYCASWRYFDDEEELKQQHILKLTVRVQPNQVADIEATFKDWPDVLVTSSGFGYIDMINPELHKAYGLQVLGKHFQISPNEMVVFGDSGNDKEMFNYAGTAYAMANAEPVLLNLTKLRAPSNEDNGVLKVLQQLLIN